MLRTATKEQIDELSRSLSNFQKSGKRTAEQERLLKNAGNLDINADVKFIGRNAYEKADKPQGSKPAVKDQKKEKEIEDDYIEEDFEEDKSDSIGEDLDEEDIEDRLLRERQEQ